MKQYFLKAPWQTEYEEVNKEQYLETLKCLDIYSGHGVGPHSLFKKYGIEGKIERR